MSSTAAVVPDALPPPAYGGTPQRIWGLMYRHLTLYRRSWPRLVDLAYWPVLQMVIWGFTSRFFAARLGSPAVVTVGVLLGAVLLWEVALRSHLGFAATFLEEVWSRNLGHIFISPLRPWEMLAALIGMSAIRAACGVIPASILAWLLYHFNVISIGPVIGLFALNLMVMGWSVALACVALILSQGGGAESLVWAMLPGLAPLAAVYYPVASMPPWIHPIVFLMPASHVFEGLRAAVGHGVILWGQLGWAALLNAVWLSAACVLFWHQFQSARRNGGMMNLGE
jgi:ABC-2 type transport system permease protein